MVIRIGPISLGEDVFFSETQALTAKERNQLTTSRASLNGKLVGWCNGFHY